MIALTTLTRAKIVVFIEEVLGLEILFAPVMVAFYLNYSGLTFGQMSVFFSVILLISWILEVPTGAFSDWLGRKRAFILGKAIYLAGMLLLFLCTDFTELLVVAGLFALGSTVGSGNLSAIVFETLAACGQKDSYFRLFSKAASVGFLSAAAAAILGGHLGHIDLRLPLLGDCVFLTLTIVVAGLFLEEHAAPKAQHTQDETVDGAQTRSLRELFSILAEGVRVALLSPTILSFVLFSSLCFGLLRTSFNFYQPLLESLGINLAGYGWVLAGLNSVAALSASLIGRLPARAGADYGPAFIAVLLFALAGTFVLSAGLSRMAVLSTLFFQQLVRGFVDPYVSTVINNQLPPGHRSRTTVLSVSFFLKAILASLLMSASGAVVARYGLLPAFGTFSIAGAALMSTVFLLSARPLKRPLAPQDTVYEP